VRTQHRHGVVDVRLHELDRRVGASGEQPGLLERCAGEVKAGHLGAEPGQRHGVGADVALQVDAAQSGDVAEQRQVEADHLAEVLRFGREPLDAVVGRRGVGRSPLVPVGAVHVEVVIHAGSVAHHHTRVLSAA